MPEQAPAVEILGLEKRFGGVIAVSDVDVSVYRGELLGLIGPNGSGKTTLLNLLSGYIKPTAGRIVIDGEDVTKHAGRPDRIARRGVSRTFQNIRLVPEFTVLQNIMLGSYRTRSAGLVSSLLGLPGARRETRNTIAAAMRIIEDLNLDVDPGALAAGLPYGSQRLMEIARAVVAEPAVVLLDEPTAGMTPSETKAVFDYLKVLRDRGLGVMVIEHDVPAITSYSDRVMALDFGICIATGSPDDVIRHPKVIEAYLGDLDSSDTEAQR